MVQNRGKDTYKAVDVFRGGGKSLESCSAYGEDKWQSVKQKFWIILSEVYYLRFSKKLISWSV